MLRCEEWCKIFVKVTGRGLNLEAAAAILKLSCSQATGPLESRRWPETDPSRVNEVKSGRRQGATKEYTLTVTLRRCGVHVHVCVRAWVSKHTCVCDYNNIEKES